MPSGYVATSPGTDPAGPGRHARAEQPRPPGTARSSGRSAAGRPLLRPEVRPTSRRGPAAGPLLESAWPSGRSQGRFWWWALWTSLAALALLALLLMRPVPTHGLLSGELLLQPPVLPVASATAGRLRQRLVQEGQGVQPGQTLFTLGPEGDAGPGWVLQAPVAGRITWLQAEPGQAVLPGRPLARLVPAQARWQARVWLPARDAAAGDGRWSVGQPVVLWLQPPGPDATPGSSGAASGPGAILGRIESRSALALPGRQLQAEGFGGPGGDQPLLAITVRLDPLPAGHEPAWLPGQPVWATLPRADEPLLHRLWQGWSRGRPQAGTQPPEGRLAPAPPLAAWLAHAPPLAAWLAHAPPPAARWPAGPPPEHPPASLRVSAGGPSMGLAR